MKTEPKQKNLITIDDAVSAVKSMGISDYYQQQIKEAEDRGYQKALDDMREKLNKLVKP